MAPRSSPTVDIRTMKIHPWSCMVDCCIACRRTVFDAPPTNDDPPACQTSQRRRAAGRRNSPLPAPATHGRGRDLQDDPLPRDRNRRHDAAPVRVRRRGTWSAVRSRLTLPPSPQPPRSSSTGSSNRRGGRRTIDDSSTQTACFVWSATRPAALVSPAAAEGEKGEHGTAALPTVHRSLTLTTIPRCTLLPSMKDVYCTCIDSSRRTA